MRLKRPSQMLSLALLSVMSSCFEVENAPPAPCYPVFYSEETSTYRYSESYTYSEHNNILTVFTENRATNSSSTSFSTLQYNYDPNKRLSKMTSSDGTTTTYAYTNGRMTSATTTSSGGQTTSKQEYTYNASGQLTNRQTYQLLNGTLTKGSYYTYEYLNTTTKNYSKRSFFNSSGVLQSTIAPTYDDKKNPRAVVNPFSPTNTTNNIIKYVFTPVTGNIVTYTYTYTYSDTGYPRSYKISTGGTNSDSFSFEYNNCDIN